MDSPIPKALRRLRVLVVDDSLDQVRSLAYLVKDCGHDVDYAVKGTVALELAQRSKPDVIIMNIFLPDTSGFELVKQIRRNPELKHIYVLAITGHHVERSEAAINGFDGLLTKPVRFADIESALAKIR